MTKIVYVTGPKKKSTAKNHKGVVNKRVRNTDGEIIHISSVDARSNTFGEDFRYVFSKNVAEARRENIAATGRADGLVKRR